VPELSIATPLALPSLTNCPCPPLIAFTYAELSFARSSGRARAAPLIFFGVQLCGLHYGIIARVVISGFCFRRRLRCSYSYVSEAGITKAEAHSFVRTNEQWYLHLRLFGVFPFCSLTHVETCFNQAFVEVATRIILLAKWTRFSVYSLLLHNYE